eukprot:Rhum_TRINITY_DN10015_c0_g1::Rhum_TRINITY_DN10015_c0_g1_i1::g.36451::m.36451
MMESFVSCVAQLRHSEAMTHCTKGLKKNTHTRRHLTHLAGLEQAYFDGKVLPPATRPDKPPPTSPAGLREQYRALSEELKPMRRPSSGARTPLSIELEVFDPLRLAPLVGKYCRLRCDLIALYCELRSLGINVVDSIPRLRSLLTAATDLKPQGGDSRSSSGGGGDAAAAQEKLHQLIQLEIDYVLSVHECLWEVNRLQYPASIVHLASAKRKLAKLQQIVTAAHTKPPRLVEYLASLYSAAHGKVTTVFLHALASPFTRDATDDDDSVDDGIASLKDSINTARLHALWPTCARSKRSTFGFGEQDSGATPNVLMSVESVQEHFAEASDVERPTFHVLYNAAAHGFSSTFGAGSWSHRRVVPRYVFCAQREVDEHEGLTGLDGFPCVASYPTGAEPCSQQVVATLASLPLLDAGNVAQLPCRLVVEVLDRERDEKKRQLRMQVLTAKKVEQERSRSVEPAAAAAAATAAPTQQDSPGRQARLFRGEVDPTSELQPRQKTEDEVGDAAPVAAASGAAAGGAGGGGGGGGGRLVVVVVVVVVV